MIDLNKKCWREKVTAEITMAHMLQFARELGTNLDATEAAAFLNERGRAQDIWTHMMQAGEQYIKANLQGNKGSLHSVKRSAQAAPMLH
jgi:hypothetical protein